MIIPLISISKIIATTLSGLATHQAYEVWKKEKENKSFKYLLGALFLTTVAFAIFIFLPLIENLYLVQLFFYFHDIFAVLIVFYFILIFLNFLGWRKFQKITFCLISLAVVALIILYFKHFNAAMVFYYNFLNLQFVGWAPTLPPSIRISLFGIIGMICFVFVIFFLKKIFSFPDRQLKVRGIFFILGMIFLWLAGIFSIIYGGLSPTSFSRELLHIFFSLLSPIFFLLFVFYKKKNLKQTG